MPDASRPPGFAATLRAAINDIAENGFVSQSQIDAWLIALRAEAEHELGSEVLIDDELKRRFNATFRKLIERGGIAQYVPDVGRYTLAMVAPELRAELDRRILASADLIKLSRRQAIEHTLRRFQGWSTAIPAGGSGVIDKREVRSNIGKSIRSQRYEKRRVQIDQGHKLIANVSELVAKGNGAIAGEWHDRGERDRSYDARKEHLARSGKIFLLRDSWARKAGLVKPGPAGYYDDVEAVGVLPFCSCWMRWISSPRRLPEEMLTRRGREWVAKNDARAA